ncbi:DUF4836 family protein [Chitinophaga nivalis]|uniref:DUF4836 family protein n=1 Tax=Chitinophaga nivalis TaxID=2991709 RepID=A0ABT3IVF7_9BACT|nr:DUF4836 family protein [Chitinophaga nivalis]MCW3462341.1 DUF4836 family protein [Chitinophaga nivalis]MCW3487968.1 DUF4836 family protein [Chitinophaga nivalis]
MKRTFSKVVLTAVSAAVLLAACSKVPDESKHIPKTAGVVLDLNAKQISQKLVTNGVTMDKLFSAVQNKDTANQMTKAWKDAENSGVDLKGHFFASVVFQGVATENKSYLSLTASLTDAAKFEDYLKKNVPDFSLKTQNDFKYIWQEKQQAVIGWTKSTVIYISLFNANDLQKFAPPGTPGLPAPTDNNEYQEEAAVADSAVAVPAALVAAEETAPKAWVDEIDHLFHLKKEETAGSIEAFAKLLKENADMGVFVNPEAIYNSAQFTMIPANFKKLMQDSYYTGTVNFEKGKIVMDGSSFMGKELAAIYKKSDKKVIDMDMLKKYPSDNITGFLSYAFDFHVIGEIIKSTGMDGLANAFLSGKSGLTLDDILNAFEGQLTYIASDFAITKKESEYFPGEFTEKPEAKWIFNLKVGNKDAFNKVMTSPLLKDMFAREGDRYVISNPMVAAGFPPISITEKFITVGSDSVLLQQYLAGKGSIKLPEGIESKVKGSMIGGYVDLEKITKTIPEDKLADDEKPLMQSVKNLFKDISLVGHPLEGNVQHTEAVLTFKNKDENSLVQLINFGTAAAKVIQDKKAKEKAYEDSLLSAPVDTAATAAY